MSIVADKVTYTYMEKTPMEKTAVLDVSFTIEQGEYLAVIGHTGSGKSTLIQHINGLIVPTQGDVLVDGVNTRDKKTILGIRKKVGLVFQYPEYQLFEESVSKDIAFGCKNMGFSEDEQQKNVKRAMKMVELDYEKYKDVSPFDLSGGQKRRVAIAGVLAMNPSTIILDEPASGLDPMSAVEILSMIKAMNQEGITVIMVTHNMDDVYTYASRAIVINDGEIMFDGTPAQVFSHERELLSVGLDVPSGCRLAYDLRQKGMKLPEGIMSVDELLLGIRQVTCHE